MHRLLLNALWEIWNSKSLGVAENNVLGQNVRKCVDNRGKTGKTYFLYDFPFSTNVKQCIVYSVIPRMTHQTFKSIEVAKHYIFGQNIRKIEVKSRKIGIPFT